MEATPTACDFFSSPRNSGRGGGLAIIFNKRFKCRLLPFTNYQSFEAQVMMLDYKKPVLCVNVYCAPKYHKDLIEEFSDFFVPHCTIV